MNLKIKTKFQLACSLFLILFITNPSYSDVVLTKDGMIFSGKIIKKSINKIIIRNYYGTFTIKKKKIKKFFVTTSFKEDVKILQKEGKRVNIREIKQNYTIGIKNTANRKKLLPPSLACFLSPAIYMPFGEFSKLFTLGYGISAEINLNLDTLLYKNKNYFLPDLSINLNFLYFSKRSDTILGYSIAIGPTWPVPVMKNGEIYFSPAPGLGFYNIFTSNDKNWAIKFCINPEIGFNYYFKKIAIKLHFRYTYIFDIKKPLHCLVFGVGIGYKFSI